MERFVGTGAGETRPAGGVPVSAEERRKAIEYAIREWWNDTMRKTWREDLADPDLRLLSLVELANIIERTPGVSVPTEPGAPLHEAAQTIVSKAWPISDGNLLGIERDWYLALEAALVPAEPGAPGWPTGPNDFFSGTPASTNVLRVPTEPGAPDPLDLTNAHYARTRTHGAHLHPGGPGDGCPEYVVGECVIDFRRAAASQPVPAPEPSARLREAAQAVCEAFPKTEPLTPRARALEDLRAAVASVQQA